MSYFYRILFHVILKQKLEHQTLMVFIGMTNGSAYYFTGVNVIILI